MDTLGTLNSMKKWTLVSQVVLALSVLQLGAIALLPFLHSAPNPATAAASVNDNPNARRVQRVENDLSLVLSASNHAPATTVRLSCLALFPDPVSRLEAKRTLLSLLDTSEGFVYLDDAPDTAAGTPQSREVHLTTGTFLQTELASSGWVRFKAEPGCRARDTIALASKQAQQQRLGGWK